MPRTVDPAAHARRRAEFLNATQRLLVTKGYERMTVQDVLDEVGTSKGALYHYFDSKQALLEGLVEQLADAGEAHVREQLEGRELPALDKLRLLFVAGGEWKAERRRVFLAALPMWHSDDNAVFRQKIGTRSTERLGPLVADIITQGVKEGAFTPAYPDQVGRVVMDLLRDCGEAVQRLLLAATRDEADEDEARRLLDVYGDALERVLGAPRRSFEIITTDQLRRWFDAAAEVAAHGTHDQTNEERPWHDARL